MIQTEEQRRWWFANHPEFSSSHKGGQRWDREARSDEDEVRPEDVDEYVDNALRYEADESVIALLKSVKRNFGTEADSSKEQQNLKAWERILAEDDWLAAAETYAEGGAFMPRMPTTKELSRWPRELVRQFFQWLDDLLQNNPLLIDPNALERHHGLPKAFIKYFLDCGMELREFIMIMRVSDHRLKAEGEGRGGVHTGEGRGGDWNTEWDKFIADHPAEKSEKRQEQIRKKFNEMVKTFGLEGKYILSPKRSRRK